MALSLPVNMDFVYLQVLWEMEMAVGSVPNKKDPLVDEIADTLGISVSVDVQAECNGCIS